MAHRRFDLTTKVVSLGIFCLGIILLYVVFGMTRAEFQGLESPSPEWSATASAPTSAVAQSDGTPAPSPALELAGTVGRHFVRVLCLFVLGYLSSLIAVKGVQLYGATRGGNERETGSMGGTGDG